MKTIITLLLTGYLFIGHAFAQPGKPERHGEFTLGVVDKIKSSRLGEERTLNIYLPDGYAKDVTVKYPVLYLLDGSADEDFVHIVGLVQFLNMIQVMPKTIVVGIANVDRKRDFTFPSTIPEDIKLVPTSGGSAKFIDFIEKDLEPYINGAYRVNGERTIIGQSLGGLLASEILLKRPSLFDRYIIVSPSLWWDKESLLKKAPSLLSAGSYKNVTAYISYGDEGDQMIGDARALIDALAKIAGIKVLPAPLPQENHLTILHRSVYHAFEMLNPNTK